MANRISLVLVSGFLGAGKTTLLLEAARRLQRAGMRAGLILNDQGAELVDTLWSRSSGLDAAEVTGGCFCCRFSEFVQSAETLLREPLDVIFAEPVGSCTDLVASMFEPLRAFYGDRFRLAPLTVLVDPSRAAAMLDPHVSYLFRKQIEEAESVWFTKADLYDTVPEIPWIRRANRLSSRSGEGVDEWLFEVLGGAESIAAPLLDIDYGAYGEAEAALGWLNWRARLECQTPASPAQVAGPFLEAIDASLTAAGIAILHLKLLCDSDAGTLRAAICANGEEPSVEGALDASPAPRHDLVLNLRALGPPKQLRAIVEQAAAVMPGRLLDLHCQAFRPSPPQPQYTIAPAS